MTRPVYSGTAQLLIERQAPSVLNFKEVAETNAGLWGDEYFQTQYKILQSRALARKVIEAMDLFEDPEFGGPRAEQVETKAGGGAGRIALAMEGTIDAFLGREGPADQEQPARERGLRGLPARARGAPRQQLPPSSTSSRASSSATRSRPRRATWLGSQIDDQRKKVEAAEIALQKVREELGILNAEEKQTLLEQKLQELGTALTTLKTARLEKEALYQQMKARAARRAARGDAEQRSSRRCASSSRRWSARRRSSSSAISIGHPEVVKVRGQIGQLQARSAPRRNA